MKYTRSGDKNDAVHTNAYPDGNGGVRTGASPDGKGAVRTRAYPDGNGFTKLCYTLGFDTLPVSSNHKARLIRLCPLQNGCLCREPD